MVLFIAAYFVNKGSVKAFLVWSGVLLYLIYAYVIYAFDVHFNSLFLVYVAILGLSFYALVGSVIQYWKMIAKCFNSSIQTASRPGRTAAPPTPRPEKAVGATFLPMLYDPFTSA